MISKATPSGMSSEPAAGTAAQADVLATVQDTLEPDGVKLWLIRGRELR